MKQNLRALHLKAWLQVDDEHLPSPAKISRVSEVYEHDVGPLLEPFLWVFVGFSLSLLVEPDAHRLELGLLVSRWQFWNQENVLAHAMGYSYLFEAYRRHHVVNFVVELSLEIDEDILHESDRGLLELPWIHKLLHYDFVHSQFENVWGETLVVYCVNYFKNGSGVLLKLCISVLVFFWSGARLVKAAGYKLCVAISKLLVCLLGQSETIVFVPLFVLPVLLNSQLIFLSHLQARL